MTFKKPPIYAFVQCGRVYAVESRSSVSEQHGFKLAAKLIPNGDGMSQRDAKEQKKISNTLNLERQYLAPGQLLNNSRDKFQYCTRLPPTDYHGADSALCMDYLVMERFDQDLTSWATRNSPSVSEIASVGLQILDGLQWLHNKAYLFIDIKPDNFMLQGENIKFIDCKYFIVYRKSSIDMDFTHWFFGCLLCVCSRSDGAIRWAQWHHARRRGLRPQRHSHLSERAGN